jgi:hypothetical protein
MRPEEQTIPDCEDEEPMIDSMLGRRSRSGNCEVCQGKQATRRARFTAHFLQADPTPLVVEEHVAKMEFERLVCDDCAEQLRSMKNVTDLSFESL